MAVRITRRTGRNSAVTMGPLGWLMMALFIAAIAVAPFVLVYKAFNAIGVGWLGLVIDYTVISFALGSIIGRVLKTRTTR